MMRKFIVAVILVSVSFAVKAQQITVTPTILRFSLDPGATSQSQVVRVTNNSTSKQSFQASIGDWIRDSLGNHTYFAPNTTENSCANWVTLTPSFFEIEPQQTLEVLVTLQAPPDPNSFDRMRWAMLFVQGAVEKTEPFIPEKKLATSVREFYRFGIHIYQTPSSITGTKVEILKTTADTVNQYSMWIKNTGTTMVECKTRVELTNLENGTEFKIENDPFPVFPSGNRKSTFTLGNQIPKGKYSMLFILDYGDSFALEAEERTIEKK